MLLLTREIETKKTRSTCWSLVSSERLSHIPPFLLLSKWPCEFGKTGKLLTGSEVVKYEVKKRSCRVTGNEANQRYITVLSTAFLGGWTTQQLVETSVCAFEECLSSVPGSLRPGPQNGDTSIALRSGLCGDPQNIHRAQAGGLWA